MKNKNLLDQFFLNDKRVLGRLLEAALVSKSDRVLEIGAGNGIITRELVKKAGQTIAIEIDEHFVPDLKKIHGNIQLIFASALDVLKNRKRYPIKFNKIIGSLPSSIVEPLMHVLTGVNFHLAIFLIPLKFAYKLVDHRVFTIYFDIEILEKISRKSFLPVPKTNWALIKIIKKPDPLKVNDKKRFLKQYIYKHPKAKLNNALVEGLIKFYRLQGKALTKNQAKKIIATKNPL